ncbi:MAG: DUF1553 domain-containing protein [Acidobacteria bacterium]|nr:DUF1553 domain-containing protein [Acidobacteriota bacterium]
MRTKAISAGSGAFALLLSGVLLSRAQDPVQEVQPPAVDREVTHIEHPECSYFLAARDKQTQANRQAGQSFTQWAVNQLSFVPGGSRTKSFSDLDNLGPIDKYLFADMEAAGVTPADKTNDFEFIRRVTLDLTGRIPASDRVLAFAADSAPDKRGKLVDELLGKPEWVDKWTMYFGDFLQNNVTKPSVGLQRFQPGRNAFWKWIRDSLSANKAYDQMARELIGARGANSYVQGEINWLVGGWVINNPVQDNWDQQTANVAETFLGIGHMNCILCHNGRGHLDSLSLWGKSANRVEAWGLSSFLSRTNTVRAPLDPQNPQNNLYYWRLDDVVPRLGDYPLNTTTGNRPIRSYGTMRNVDAFYPFSGRGPKSGENYRDALAREVTSDFQFARAAVNYIWKEFFGRGMVEPANQFDPARLDPDNPPTAINPITDQPWALQPSNARLLNALAQDFIDNGYDLKKLMRQLATSEAYQLSAIYTGPDVGQAEKLFARKLARRLWAEEVHDAIAQATGVIPSYNVAGFSSWPANSPFASYPSYGNVSWAMQFPDVTGTPMGPFLDAFIRGDRDTEDRRGEGSLLQALNLMNDPLVTDRVSTTRSPATSLVRKNLGLPDDSLVDTLYLNALSRYPSPQEKSAALASLKLSNRNQRVENLLWSLLNKVDFFINY